MIRLYPSSEQENALESLEHDSRRAWNWLVKQTEDVLEANKAYAVRNGLVVPRPIAPEYSGLTPEEAKAAKREYIAACKKWRGEVYTATKGLGEFRKLKDHLNQFGCKFDYQLLQKVINWRFEDTESVDERPIKPGAHLLQALTKNFFTKSDRRKKFRKASDDMPLQVRSGHCFDMGSFGGRRNNPDYYNCQIKFNGLKIRGRLPGRRPIGRVLEGVSITRQADGWWASIKVEQEVRSLPDPIPGTKIGLDVGLIDMVAFSEPVEGRSTVPNPRTKEFVERVAGIQAIADQSGDKGQQATARRRIARLHQRMHRRTLHELYNNVVAPVAKYETIVIEDLCPKIGQMGQKHMSVMRTVRTLLTQRYGERVREVDCRYTSQECSQCGYREKESWSCENGRTGECTQCGYREHRDVNAARNIAARAA